MYITCKCCGGSGHKMGVGMIMIPCEDCDSKGKIFKKQKFEKEDKQINITIKGRKRGRPSKNWKTDEI